MTAPLPRGWRIATIQDVAGEGGIVTDGDWVESKDQDPKGKVRLIQLADVGDGQFLNRSSRFMTKEAAQRLQCTFLKPGDLLVARMPDPLGRACIFPGLQQPAVTAVDVLIWRGGYKSADARWLMHIINSPEVRDQLAGLAGGTTRQRVSGGNIKRLEIPVPPLAEQRRIVARIEALFARTRRARTDLERIASLSNKYFAATMKKSFEGLLTETWRSEPQVAGTQNRDNGLKGPYELPSGWSWQYLPALGELARGKSRHRPRNAGFLYGGPYPFIQTGDVRAAQGRLRTYEQTYSEAGLAQSKLWPRDTVCITIAANIAETAILDIEACFPDSVVGFKAAQHTCLPEFIEYFIRTAKADLAAFAPATAQKNINLETLEGVLVPTPSLAEQRECVRLLSRSELAADACRREATRALALLDRLEQSILARAFRGELVSSSSTREQDTISQIPVEKDMPTTGRRKVRAVAA